MVRTIAHRLKLMILAISVVALSMALLPASTASGYRYDGPTAVPGVPGTVVQLSTSNSVSYALTQRGEVWAWGAGQFGGLGNGTSPAVQVQPVQVQFPAGIRIASLPSPTPYDAGMAIDTKGHIWGWGSDYEHPFCIGQGNLLYPKKLPFRHVTLASGAGWHALYESDGTLYACGGNAGGELGNGTTVGSITPVRVNGLPDEPIKTLVTSWENSGALLANGSFYDWGYNAADQLGNGTTTDSDVPVHVALPATVAQVSMGGSDKGNGQTVAILKNGAIWAWGSDQFGQVGNDRTEPSSAPAPVAVPPGVTLVQVNSGGSTMFGIDVRGALWSWGENNLGQLGVGGAPFSDVPDEVGLKLSCVSSTATNVAGLRDSARPSSAVCVHSATGRPHHKGRD
jgi:alpha-tubulin suppressor-like RCC1 family protein